MIGTTTAVSPNAYPMPCARQADALTIYSFYFIPRPARCGFLADRPCMSVALTESVNVPGATGVQVRAHICYNSSERQTGRQTGDLVRPEGSVTPANMHICGRVCPRQRSTACSSNLPDINFPQRSCGIAPHRDTSSPLQMSHHVTR